MPEDNTPEDPWQDPGWLEYAKRAREELRPTVKKAVMGMSVLDGKDVDPRTACELGYLILMDKPILIVVEPGVHVPDKIVKIADEIVEGGPLDDAFKQRLVAAIERVEAKLREAKA